MALLDPFAGQFREGDVIYGAGEARQRYMESLPANVRLLCEAHGCWLICDDYNNKTFNRSEFDGGTHVQTRADINTNLTMNYNDPLIPSYHRARLNAYYSRLSQSSRSPNKVVQMELAKVVAKGNHDHAELAFRRACKFGLEYFLMERRVQVHFVLDLPANYNAGDVQVDQDVVDKTRYHGLVPVTTSELRCCYRNKDRWIPTGRLKFYRNLVEVEPPWVSNQAVWAQYGIARHVKHRPVLNMIARWFI